MPELRYWLLWPAGSWASISRLIFDDGLNGTLNDSLNGTLNGTLKGVVNIGFASKLVLWRNVQRSPALAGGLYFLLFHPVVSLLA